MQAAAASGFKFSYGDAEVPRLLDTLQQKKSWEQEYKAYIKVSLTLSHTAHTGVSPSDLVCPDILCITAQWQANLCNELARV